MWYYIIGYLVIGIFTIIGNFNYVGGIDDEDWQLLDDILQENDLYRCMSSDGKKKCLKAALCIGIGMMIITWPKVFISDFKDFFK